MTWSSFNKKVWIQFALIVFVTWILGIQQGFCGDYGQEPMEISNSDYKVRFDHGRVLVDMDDNSKKTYFKVLDKKTRKTSKMLLPTYSEQNDIDGLWLHSQYLSVFEYVWFPDRSAGFFLCYDLKKGENLGEINEKEIEPEKAEISPNGKYFVYCDFLNVGMDLAYTLSTQIEMVALSDDGWKHLFLNGKAHDYNLSKGVGIDSPRPVGKTPEHYLVISNLLWSPDSQKVIFVAAQDAYFAKPKNSDDFEDAVIPSYGLVVLDLSKGAAAFKFYSVPFDISRFPIPKDNSDYGDAAHFYVQLKWQGKNPSAKIEGSREVNQKSQSWETPWQIQKLVAGN